MIWRRDKSLAERENMQHRGSSDSRATADSHCAAQGSRNEMEMSRQRSCRDVLLIWLVKLQERVKRVDTFVRDSRQVLRINIKGFQCFDHCLTEGHLRGTTWSFVGKPKGEQTSGQTIKGHAADMSKPSQLTAGDVFVH